MEEMTKPSGLSLSTKFLIGLGMVGFGVGYVGYRISQRIWKFFYPPSLSRYAAVTMLFGTSFCVRNCDYVSEKVTRGIDYIDNRVVSMANKPSQVQPIQTALPLQPKVHPLERLVQDFSHVIHIDKSKSNLEIYSGKDKMASYRYISGSNPRPKGFEGDKATPEGIYRINDAIISQDLSSLYGKGLLHLNYPNGQDASRGLTGGGIVICGTDLEERKKALADGNNITNGSIVMSNESFLDMYQKIRYRISTTAVFIENSGAKNE